MDHNAILSAHTAARAVDYNLCIVQGMVIAGHYRDASARVDIAKAKLAELAAIMGFDLVPRLDAVKAAREVA